MIGQAVSERCPNCRKVLDVIAAPRGVRVVHRRKCDGRGCRGRDAIYFIIENGTAQALTRQQAEAMMAA